jgi:hypothetical protein
VPLPPMLGAAVEGNVLSEVIREELERLRQVRQWGKCAAGTVQVCVDLRSSKCARLAAYVAVLLMVRSHLHVSEPCSSEQHACCLYPAHKVSVAASMCKPLFAKNYKCPGSAHKDALLCAVAYPDTSCSVRFQSNAAAQPP